MKRFVCFVVLFALAACTLIPLPSIAAAPDVSARSAILIAPQTGDVLFEHNADQRMPIASLTKVMTAVVVLEKSSLSEVVSVAPEACGIEGSSIYLVPGEKLTVAQLLYAVMLRSANDAAAALAIHVAGSIEAFVSLMNEKVAALGLDDTSFSNPHGLDGEDHYSTARDLAELTEYALDVPGFRNLVSCKRCNVPFKDDTEMRYLKNHNRLLFTYNGCIGVKTGYTKTAGRCLITAAERDGVLLVAVTLNDPNDWRDHEALLDFGFESVFRIELKGKEITIPVVSGTGSMLLCRIDDVEVFTLSADTPITSRMFIPRFIFAPVRKGSVVGFVTYFCGGEVVAKADVICEKGVERIKYPLTYGELLRIIIG